VQRLRAPLFDPLDEEKLDAGMKCNQALWSAGAESRSPTEQSDGQENAAYDERHFYESRPDSRDERQKSLGVLRKKARGLGCGDFCAVGFVNRAFDRVFNLVLQLVMFEVKLGHFYPYWAQCDQEYRYGDVARTQH
jgi:hypothetical protein